MSLSDQDIMNSVTQSLSIHIEQGKSIDDLVAPYAEVDVLVQAAIQRSMLKNDILSGEQLKQQMNEIYADATLFLEGFVTGSVFAQIKHIEEQSPTNELGDFDEDFTGGWDGPDSTVDA